MINENTDFFKYVDNFAKYKNVKSSLIIGEIDGNKRPLITIAIPTYKRPKLLKEAIDSALDQVGFDDYEVIIVDNDDTFEIKSETQKLIESYDSDKLFYYKNDKNIGMFGNWNRCIELANGKYISILNDDDWLEKEFLKEITKLIKENRACFSNYNTIDLRGKSNYRKKVKKSVKFNQKIKLLNMLLGNISAGTLGTLFNKEKVISLGGYNENFFPSSDYYFHSNYIKKFGGIKTKFILSNYRIHENESAKKENLEKWPIIDGLFKIYISKFINLPNVFLEYLITESQKDKENYLISFWGKNDKKLKISILYRFTLKLIRIINIL